MSRNNFSKNIIIFILILSVFILLSAAFISIYKGDPHWMNRAGALMTAAGAAAILFQVKAEMRIEDDKQKISEKKMKTETPTPAPTPLENLEKRIRNKKLEDAISKLSEERFFFSTFVAVIAIIGEIFHGFGDIFLCILVDLCTKHS